MSEARRQYAQRLLRRVAQVARSLLTRLGHALRVLRAAGAALWQKTRRQRPERATTEEPLTKGQGWARQQPVATDGSSRELLRLLMDLCTGLWRIRRRLPVGEQTDLSDEARRLVRHVESTWDIVVSAGVNVRDHTGERYVPGLALKVIAFQPTPGVNTEIVDETIKPSIFYRDKLIQWGEVIVATPPTEPPSDGEPEGRGDRKVNPSAGGEESSAPDPDSGT